MFLNIKSFLDKFFKSSKRQFKSYLKLKINEQEDLI